MRHIFKRRLSVRPSVRREGEGDRQGSQRDGSEKEREGLSARLWPVVYAEEERRLCSACARAPAPRSAYSTLASSAALEDDDDDDDDVASPQTNSHFQCLYRGTS